MGLVGVASAFGSGRDLRSWDGAHVVRLPAQREVCFSPSFLPSAHGLSQINKILKKHTHNNHCNKQSMKKALVCRMS